MNNLALTKEIQPKLWRLLYRLVQENQDLSQEEVCLKIAELLVGYSFSSELAIQISELVYNRVKEDLQASFDSSELEIETATDEASETSPKPTTEPPKDQTCLSKLDIEELRAHLTTTEEGENTPLPLARLLVAFAVFARAAPHHSGWIKYDKKLIFYLAGLSKIPVSKQEILTQALHQKYGLNMRVVGSTQPIACFQLTWQAKQPDPFVKENAPTNPLFNLGALSPETIEALAKDYMLPQNQPQSQEQQEQQELTDPEQEEGDN